MRKCLESSSLKPLRRPGWERTSQAVEVDPAARSARVRPEQPRRRVGAEDASVLDRPASTGGGSTLMRRCHQIGQVFGLQHGGRHIGSPCVQGT